MRNKYFGIGVKLHIQAFNLLACAGIVAGVAVAISSIFSGAGIVNIAINLIASLLAVVLLYYANRTGRFQFCCILTVVTVFMIAFPVLFFSAGGYHSGMPCFFLMAILFTALMLNGLMSICIISAEVCIYVGSCFIAYFYPTTVTHFDSEWAYLLDLLTGIIVSSTLLLLVIMLYIRIYNGQKHIMEELNLELAARNEALLRLDQLKDEFLVTVMHELKSPLVVISGNAADTIDLLDEKPLSHTSIKNDQNIIIRTVKRIDDILLDLTDKTAMENGRVSLNRTSTNLASLIHHVCDTCFYALNKERSNCLSYKIMPNLSNVMVDQGRIEQVLINLITNAAHHTNNGLITITLAEDNHDLIISVKDTGMGIPARILRQLMLPYINVSLEDAGLRIGNGLLISQKIIRAHGGSIWIDSEEGFGTIVSFTLPKE
ncbi:MAG: HAMP domain-containing histidine kinase [Clostridiales Family XIII bacterium]|jgi:signal transduction histidine kinase|nr:HAMP domain-containing histidine kinase [Clostridiales Family XIII bacterium]